jgi:hypothetical protein
MVFVSLLFVAGDVDSDFEMMGSTTGVWEKGKSSPLGVVEYWGNALKRYSSGDVWTGYVDRRASSR